VKEFREKGTMKSVRCFIVGVIIIGSMVASLNLLYAQAAMVGSFNNALLPVQSATPDSIVQLTADAQGLAQIAPADLPRTGTYWLVMPSGFPAPAPCPPLDPGVPVYQMASGQFLVDETGGQVAVNPRRFGMQAQSRSSAVTSALAAQVNTVLDLITRVETTTANQQMLAMGLDVPSPGGGGSDGTNGFYSDSFNFHPDYGTNLFIAQASFASGGLSGIVSNSFADIQYEIQYKTDLAQDQWQSAGWFAYGSELTNWTPFSVPGISQTNLFLRIRSWQDDGSGLPIWWQEQYFGTTGVDPYGDPAGDGWNNLQKFQNGMNPNVFYTPPAPQGLTVQYNSVNNTAQINWLPSSGPVTGYTVERGDVNQVLDYNASQNATSIQDGNVPQMTLDFFDVNGPSILVNYKIKAHYAGGDSAWSAPVPLESNPNSLSDRGFPFATFIAGPQGSVFVSAPILPQGTIALRIWRDGPVTNFDIPVSNITNGLYAVPASWGVVRTNADGERGSVYWVQAVITNNDLSSAGDNNTGYRILGFPSDNHRNGWLVPPYFDGRAQLKQNLIFQLRAAMKDFPFEYTATWWEYNPWMVFSNSPNYVYAGFYQLDEVPNQYSTYEKLGSFDPFWPFEINWRYRNFVFGLQDLGPDNGVSHYNLGHTMTGVSGNYDDYYSQPQYYPTPMMLGTQEPETSSSPTYTQPEYVFYTPDGLNNGDTIPSLLAASDTQWLCSYALDSPEMYFDGNYGNGSDMISYGYLEEIGVTPSVDTDWDAYYNTYKTMASNARNYWGLPFVSAMIAYGTDDPGTGYVGTSILSAGNQIENIDGCFYPEVAQPQFQMAEYDFWNSSPVPGMTNFVNGQPGDLLIAPVGGSIGVNGYAKLAVLNAYSGVFGYLGQYFDQAYQIDGNGNVTTNTTGVLSPYGNFFATEPGPAALVTMPDIDTGERGTGVVYCASMNVDKNHDGIMDLSFSGHDATAAGNPMGFWVNSGWDDQNGVDRPNYGNTNYMDGQIEWQRDLENFARLWICGVPPLPSAQGYSVTLSWQSVSGNPAVNLFRSVETNGGIGYLTDTNVAAAQTVLTLPNGPGLIFAHVPANGSFTFPANFFDGTNKYFLFEGSGIGSGELTLTISQNGNIIAQTGVWLDLHDIKDFYEQAHVTGVTTSFPAMVNSPTVSGFQSDHELPLNNADDKQLIVFVHGWRMSQWAYGDFSDTMFKRLYWAGYQGRFATLQWPTPSSDNFNYLPDAVADTLSKLTYNASEHIAFDSANGAAQYFAWMRQRFPDYSINVAAHSQGNLLMMEVLKQMLDTGVTNVLDNYVMMQAAVPAQCYDTSFQDYLPFLADDSMTPTPNTYFGYPGQINQALRPGGLIINFFNPQDYAVGTAWEANQSLNKPDSGYFYYPGNGSYYFSRLVTDPHELMPFVARPRSQGAAVVPGIAGAIQGGEVNLNASFGFAGLSSDHSGEFNRNVQQTTDFYSTLLEKLLP
jgi:hypothetical protein